MATRTTSSGTRSETAVSASSRSATASVRVVAVPARSVTVISSRGSSSSATGTRAPATVSSGRSSARAVLPGTSVCRSRWIPARSWYVSAGWSSISRCATSPWTSSTGTPPGDVENGMQMSPSSRGPYSRPPSQSRAPGRCRPASSWIRTVGPAAPTLTVCRSAPFRINARLDVPFPISSTTYVPGLAHPGRSIRCRVLRIGDASPASIRIVRSSPATIPSRSRLVSTSAPRARKYATASTRNTFTTSSATFLTRTSSATGSSAPKRTALRGEISMSTRSRSAASAASGSILAHRAVSGSPASSRAVASSTSRNGRWSRSANASTSSRSRKCWRYSRTIP